jgi:hypothetical protein
MTTYIESNKSYAAKGANGNFESVPFTTCYILIKKNKTERENQFDI